MCMEHARPWWRGLEIEVRDAVAGMAWAADVGGWLDRLQERLAERLPGAVMTREAGAELVVAWDGVGGRSEVCVMVENALVHEGDVARIMARAFMRRAPGRTLVVALAAGVSPALALGLAVSLLGEDPVIGGTARVVQLRGAAHRRRESAAA